MTKHWIRLPTLLLALAPLASGQGVAQAPTVDQDPSASHGPGDVVYLGLNALVGGLTAGLWQELSDGSFGDAFAGGALGGGVSYAGKRVAAETFAGAGFLGREVAAVGASIVRNASDARPLLDSLRLPVGPLRVYVSPRDPGRFRLEADVHNLYRTAQGLADDDLRLDLGESLSSGLPVFRSDRALRDTRGRAVLGVAVGGAVFLSPVEGAAAERTLAHERSHVLQDDFLYHAWLRPLEDRFARTLPHDGFVNQVDYDVLLAGLRWAGRTVGPGEPFLAPFQAEAEFLEHR